MTDLMGVIKTLAELTNSYNTLNPLMDSLSVCALADALEETGLCEIAATVRSAREVKAYLTSALLDDRE